MAVALIQPQVDQRVAQRMQATGLVNAAVSHLEISALTDEAAHPISWANSWYGLVRFTPCYGKYVALLLNRAITQRDLALARITWLRTEAAFTTEIAMEMLNAKNQDLQAMQADRNAKQQNFLEERRLKEAALQACIAAQQQIGALQANVNGLTANLQASNQQTAQAKDALQGQIAQAHQNGIATQHQIGTLQANVDNLTANLQVSNQQTAQVQGQRNALQGQYDALQRDFHGERRQKELAQQAHNAAQRQIAGLQATVMGLTRETTKLTQQAATRIQENGRLLGRLQELYRQVEKVHQVTEGLRALQQKNQQLMDTVEQLRQEMHRQEAQILITRQEKEALQQRLAGL